ncbi:hypothetical protein Scep_019368 [Stephania cephalantha]|uniref:Uncharacterized protein n=1 Tax=Stephania cephalantha TaxID=152367 RepID=A0AAP0NMU6_9MAGN
MWDPLVGIRMSEYPFKIIMLIVELFYELVYARNSTVACGRREDVSCRCGERAGRRPVRIGGRGRVAAAPARWREPTARRAVRSDAKELTDGGGVGTTTKQRAPKKRTVARTAIQRRGGGAVVMEDAGEEQEGRAARETAAAARRRTARGAAMHASSNNGGASSATRGNGVEQRRGGALSNRSIPDETTTVDKAS